MKETYTAEEVREILYRMNRTLGRERGRYVRLYNDPMCFGASKERAYGEINVIGLAMNVIRNEIEKLGIPRKKKET